MGVKLSLLQPGGADYAHHITASPPGFENPAAALYYNDMPQFMSIVMIQGYKDIKINGKKYNENDIGMRFTVNKTTTNFALNVKFRPYENSSQLDQLPFDYAEKYLLEITLKVS